MQKHGGEYNEVRETLDGARALRAVDAARLLGIGTRTLWTLTKAGDIPHARIGRRVVYPLAGLRQWLAARTQYGTK